jgi:hypothetical protein
MLAPRVLSLKVTACDPLKDPPFGLITGVAVVFAVGTDIVKLPLWPVAAVPFTERVMEYWPAGRFEGMVQLYKFILGALFVMETEVPGLLTAEIATVEPAG